AGRADRADTVAPRAAGIPLGPAEGRTDQERVLLVPGHGRPLPGQRAHRQAAAARRGHRGGGRRMSERDREFLRFYEPHRIKDQLSFYTQRLDEFDRATGQGLFLSATILGFASGAGALAGTTLQWAKGWAAVAAILSAVSTALAAYLALYAFEQQSKI